MDTLIVILKWISENWELLLAGVVGLVSATLGIAMVIPGDQPDQFLQGLLNFMMKFSRKPKDPQ